MSESMVPEPSSTPVSASGLSTPSLSTTSSSSTSSSSGTDARGKSKSPAVKPPNVFSDDGSFLDRLKRSIKEDEGKKKNQETLERKKNFSDRFKNRGKRPPPPQSPSPNTDSDEETPKKKQKVSAEHEEEDNSAQAKYQKAVDSYPRSLKDGGTGVRPLVK